MALSLLVRSAVFALLLVAASAGPNPVTKVIKLLEDLRKEVEDDGAKEAKTYGKFACFCKDTTKEKSKSITKGEDSISSLSGAITDDTASKEEKEAEVKERKENHESLGNEMTSTVDRCMTQQAEFEAGDADMTKAIESLNKAIKAMTAKKKGMKLTQAKAGAKSFIELDKDEQMAMVFAGLDPSDPAYKYHSAEINEILAKLLKDFKDEKSDGADKWGKTQNGCNKQKDGINKKMKANLVAIDKAEEKIDNLKEKIAKDRGDLVSAQEQLQEDELYLKDLTQTCEEKARDFDQRSQMRNDEITALSAATKIMTNKVKGADADVNRGNAFVQAAPAKPLSFLQEAPVKIVTNFLARTDSSSSEQIMHERVITLLRLEGSRLGSVELSMLAMQINGPDHFAKVKNIIQSLIERLLDEKKAEASKKGFCDTEIAKANKDRDHQQNQAMGMSADLKDLEATKEQLESDLKTLAKEIREAEKALKKALGLRKDEKAENEATLKQAQDGLDALNEAILILKSFYSSASRARVFLQSPIDADTAGAGFGGAYKGNEKGSRAIFDLLETISGDFQKTISETETAEANAAAEFVEFDRESKSSIGSKETKTKLNKQDLKKTNTNIENTLDDLQTAMDLQHDALKMIESLKPSCLDAGGMNFEERSAKRDEEIAALNKALCILTPGKKEGECK